ncbi:MAG: SOS response-associated peptidase [Gemmataceae bacterium]|nr:SOS response-associated peptidase [Gemmataceae bacterium]
MCGRFTLTRPPAEVADLFGVEIPEIAPRWNIAPTQPVLAVRRDGAALLRWGLVPSWAQDLSIGVRMLNARGETVREKPAFRTAFAKRRCLVPADGFYEWRTVGKKRLPLHFRLGGLFAIGGVWERWRDVETVALLTTQANDAVRVAHDRMPVIVPQQRWAAWLAEGEIGDDWLMPWPAERTETVEADPFVNNARNEGPQCWAA